MITPEEMLRIAEMLESPKANFRNGECMVHPTLFHASRLLRSIAAEREAERERCAHIGYVTCAATRHVTLGNQVRENILSGNLDAAISKAKGAE